MFRKFIYLAFLVIILCTPDNLNSQSKRAQNWYFGGYSSLDFSTNPPTPKYNSSMNQREGVSSVSDSEGNLLFYTDGKTIYSKNHSPMPNGQNLTGHESSTQSALILNNPRTDNIYYVFTNEGVESDVNGFRYNIVDMTRDNGLGDVRPNRKNHLIFSEYTEKMTSVYSKDGSKIWLITHLDQSKDYYVYNIESGFNITPKVYTGIFKPTSRNDKIGYLKAFAGGTKLANSYYDTGVIELADFNPDSGIISNFDTLNIFPGIYGLEFSPNGRYLYASTVTFPSYLLQVNIETKDIKVIAQRNKVGEHFGALQVGIDGKIYVSDDYKNGISVINKPNNFFQGCEFVYEQIKFDSSYCQLGLPNNTQTWYYKYGIDDDKTICEGNPIRLNCWTDTDKTDESSKYTWFNPDGAVISNKQSHIIWNSDVTDSGEYEVIIDNMTGVFEMTVNVTVERKSEASTNFKNKVIVCDSSYYRLSLDLEEDVSEYDILWSTGETSPFIDVNQSGTYSVEINDKTGCFYKEFSTEVVFSQLKDEVAEANVEYFNLCSNEPEARLEIDIQPHIEYIYRWFDSDGTLITTSKFFTTIQSGYYTFEVQDETTGCLISGEVEVSFRKNGEFVLSLGEDVETCLTQYETDLLISDETDKIYLWSNGEITKNITIDKTGLYSVLATDTLTGCSHEDSIFVQINRDDIDIFPSEIIDKIYTTDEKIFYFQYFSNTDVSVYLKDGSDFILSSNGEIVLINNQYGRYIDTIVVESERCGIVEEIPIQIDNVLKVNMTIPWDTASIGDDVCLRIDVSSGDNLSFIPDFIYDEDVFYLTDVYWQSNDIIICGTVLLCNKEFTNIVINETNLKSDFIELSYNEGRLYVREICVQDIRQLNQTTMLDLKVYPNPTNNPSSVQYSGPSGKVIKVYNSMGRLVIQDKLFDESGIYNLEVKSSGNYLIVLKYGNQIIKENLIFIK